jgi:tRNA pseudouridine13 synthase
MLTLRVPGPKGKLGWEELGGQYLHFTLYKENKDTMEVLYFIASQLKVPAKNFQFAGTKDRRGVTVQRVAIFRVYAESIAKLNPTARGWAAGGFEYKKHGLGLGELTGNEFTLTLRDCHFEGEQDMTGSDRLTLAKDVVSKAADSFKTTGFLNYYGLQRFGTFSNGTHITGMKILQGDLEGAIDVILAYQPNLLPENQDFNAGSKVPQDDIARADTIRHWRKSGKLEGYLPRRFQAEYNIMQYLSKKDKRTGKPIQAADWQGALMTIPRNLRLMYVHAYQSFVWNTMVARRWKEFGNQVVAGDLVIVGEKDGEAPAPKEEVDQDGELVVRPAEHDQAPSAEDKFVRARHLSAEEASSDKYDIFDIVLPLPGFDVLYPQNSIGEHYKEFMGSEEGGKLDPHEMRRSWKEVSMSGSYRKVMARPLRGVEVQVREYEGMEQLVETDLEKAKKAGGVVKKDEDEKNEAKNAKNEEDAKAGAKTEDGKDTEVAMKDGDDDKAEMKKANAEEEGELKEDSEKKIAVVMKFQLGSSQYATMALRELTKGAAEAFKPDYSTTR